MTETFSTERLALLLGAAGHGVIAQPRSKTIAARLIIATKKNPERGWLRVFGSVLP
jgi:hypothetical protein